MYDVTGDTTADTSPISKYGFGTMFSHLLRFQTLCAFFLQLEFLSNSNVNKKKNVKLFFELYVKNGK